MDFKLSNSGSSIPWIPKVSLYRGFDHDDFGQTRFPWTAYHGKRTGVKLQVAYSPELELPMDVIETIGLRHDGPVGKALADKRYIFVEDRAYFKIERLDQFVKNEKYFVI